MTKNHLKFYFLLVAYDDSARTLFMFEDNETEGKRELLVQLVRKLCWENDARLRERLSGAGLPYFAEATKGGEVEP